MNKLMDTIRTKELLIKHLDNLISDKQAEIDKLIEDFHIEETNLSKLRDAKRTLDFHKVDYS